MRAPLRSLRRLAPALVAVVLACAGSPEGLAPKPPVPADRDVELFVQRRLMDARAFREQGRLEAAQRALERALAFAPDDPAVHRLLGRVLEEQGRRAEALEHLARADALDPPPPPPPDAPLGVESEGLVVLLVEPADPDGADARARLPDPGAERALLTARLKTRLPWARVVQADPESVDAARRLLYDHGARAALSLRSERGFCGYSRKDGDFAVAWLRVASATPQRLVAPPTTVREVIADPPAGDACLRFVLPRALEKALLETDAVRAVDEATDAGGWPSPALRALFPGIGRRVTLEIERGRARLATGRVAEAAEAFRAAVAIDPDDPDAQSFLREAEDTLAIARALSPAPGGADPAGDLGQLAFSLTPAERAIAEALLVDERRRRDELLAALVITEVEERPPGAQAVATLRPIRLPDPPASGPRLAQERVEGPVEARASYDGDGSVVAVYYFAVGDTTPVLREEDTSGDGVPDRWIGYSDGVRRDVWEARAGRAVPDVHVQFADFGMSVERIEVDDDRDGHPERVFLYADQRLASEARDTNGDDVLDRFETFDEDGRVTLREEDLDADGRPDVRTLYRDGRLVSREIEDPQKVEMLLGGE